MATLKVILWIASIALIAADESCPTTDIKPCTCDGEGLNCMGYDITLDHVKNAFKAPFKYQAIRSVWIQGTNITHIPADTFGFVACPAFQIEVNKITSIDLDAFKRSSNQLQLLSLFGNQINTFDYTKFTQYGNLAVLNLGRNQITSIPNNAFSSNSLSNIILAQNKISHIGMNAFSACPNLYSLEMSYNPIKTLGPLSFANLQSTHIQINLPVTEISSVSNTAFDSSTPDSINLSHNKLTSLPYDAFGSLVTRMGNAGGHIVVSANDFSCVGCDYSWMEKNKHVLSNVFIDFTCADGRRMEELKEEETQCKI